jgi:hypothetical protein
MFSNHRFNLVRAQRVIQVYTLKMPKGSRREIAFKKFSDNKMIVKYLEQGQ